MRGVFSNANDINLFLMVFPRMSLHCKLVPVHYREYEIQWSIIAYLLTTGSEHGLVIEMVMVYAQIGDLHWLPVRLRVDFKILLVTFKILHGVVPSYLKDLVFVLPDSHYQLRRNNNGTLLERPRLRTKKTMGDRAFSIAVSFLWNSFPLPIR